MWITKEEYANYLKEMEPEVYEKLKSEGRLESYLELKMKQAKPKTERDGQYAFSGSNRRNELWIGYGDPRHFRASGKAGI